LVAGRLADDFFARVDFFAAAFFPVAVFAARAFALDPFACAGVLAFDLAGAFFFVVALVPVVAATPDDTRVECFVRCRTFFGAASTLEASVNAASNATSNLFNVVRTMTFPPVRYDSSSARPLCRLFVT
jgi:hypothetical protein